jgi:hypothetical protein
MGVEITPSWALALLLKSSLLENVIPYIGQRDSGGNFSLRSTLRTALKWDVAMLTFSPSNLWMSNYVLYFLESLNIFKDLVLKNVNDKLKKHKSTLFIRGHRIEGLNNPNQQPGSVKLISFFLSHSILSRSTAEPNILMKAENWHICSSMTCLGWRGGCNSSPQSQPI